MIYVALLRGINVGGNNKVPMAELRECFDELGFDNVRTYIASGNVIFESDLSAPASARKIEKVLPEKFSLNREILRVLVVSIDQLNEIVRQAPSGFGEQPGKYRCDTLFLIDKTSAEVVGHIETHPDVDKAWPGDGVIYFQRLNAKLTRSRMSKVTGKPIYQHITIRSWNTTVKLLELMSK